MDLQNPQRSLQRSRLFSLYTHADGRNMPIQSAELFWMEKLCRLCKHQCGPSLSIIKVYQVLCGGFSLLIFVYLLIISVNYSDLFMTSMYLYQYTTIWSHVLSVRCKEDTFNWKHKTLCDAEVSQICWTSEIFEGAHNSSYLSICYCWKLVFGIFHHGQ